MPRAIAEAVCEEASVWLRRPLPRRWVRELIAHANAVHASNVRFRRKMFSPGDAGRDWLWMFMRHWLAALIRRRDEVLFARLPGSYCVGADLPEVAL